MVLLVEAVKQRRVVACACRRAAAVGIAPGTALSVARASLTGASLVVEEYNPRRVSRAQHSLARWCHRYSPVVAIEEGANGLCLDVTGCTHLFGGEPAMAAKVRADFARLGFDARVAIAPTFAAARGMTRFRTGPTATITPAELRDSVAPLPTSSLGIEDAAVASLEEVGIRRVGELLALPRAAVAARFGEAVLDACDRMLGRRREVIDPLRPAEPIRVERLFDGPCRAVEAIALTCRDLLDTMCRTLEARGIGTTEWAATLARSDLDPLTLPLRHAAPSRDPRHLFALLAPRLEKAHLGFGVEGVTLCVRGIKRIQHHQSEWWDGREMQPSGIERRADVLVDTLANRLGAENVLRASLVESHVPERAFGFHSAIDPVPSAGHAIQPVTPATADRPTRLFEHPKQVEVVALHPDGPVCAMRAGNETHELITCIGPERVCGEWWLGERDVRDYFKVQNRHGHWLWLYRDARQGAWYLHGEWA